jgi:hypothetical protein
MAPQNARGSLTDVDRTDGPGARVLAFAFPARPAAALTLALTNALRNANSGTGVGCRSETERKQI